MRYYSSTAGGMTLTAGIGAADTTIAVNTVVGLPVSYPYTLVIEPGVGGQEEIVTVTAAGGLSLTVTRGQDSTVGVVHGLGSAVRHMMTARDLREPQEHIAATADVHGTTGSLVGATSTQTIDNKTFLATGDHTALTARAAVGQTAPTVSVQDSAGAPLWAIGSDITSSAVSLRTAGGAGFWGEAIEVTVPSGKDGVVVNHPTGSTGYAWKSQKAGVNKALVDIDGNATFAGVTATTAAVSTVTAGTSTDVLGTALSVIRTGAQVGRIDNNATGLRVQATAGNLQLRGTGNTGMSVDATGNVTVDGKITSVGSATPIDDRLAALETGAWTSYTPVLTSTGAGPSTPTALGRYRIQGKTATFQIQITCTASPGTGLYVVSLPFTPAATGFDQTVVAGFYDASTSRHYVGKGIINPSSPTIVRTHLEAGSVLASGVPVVQAAGDIIYYAGTVEIA